MPAFDPAAHGFATANAVWLAEFSRLVYRHDAPEKHPDEAPSRGQLLREAGFETLAFVSDSRWGIHALLAQSVQAPHFAVLAFRGTEQNWRNCVIDADLGLAGWSKHPGTHKGFERALNQIWPQVAAALGALQIPVFFTGHSLGGALAVLAATRRAPQAVYAFGCPRVGNAAFAALHGHLPIYRIVHGVDVVTQVPPPWLGYRHIGQAHVLPAADTAARAQLGWWQRLAFPPRLLGHHAPIHYLDQTDATR